MKKINASSDKNNRGENFLPAETLWRTASMFCQKGKVLPPLEAEPAPLEMLGLTIGILRRRKHISRIQFAQKIGCSEEELLALEAGLLPMSELVKRLPLIVNEVELSENILQPFVRNIKLV